MDKHYAEYYFAGGFVSETSIKELHKRSSRVALDEMPEKAYGFRLFDRQEVMMDGETLNGKKKNVSGMFIKGRQFSLEEIRAAVGYQLCGREITRTLLSNMETNNWAYVVLCNQGFLPLRQEDTIIA